MVCDSLQFDCVAGCVANRQRDHVCSIYCKGYPARILVTEAQPACSAVHAGLFRVAAYCTGHNVGSNLIYCLYAGWFHSSTGFSPVVWLGHCLSVDHRWVDHYRR